MSHKSPSLYGIPGREFGPGIFRILAVIWFLSLSGIVITQAIAGMGSIEMNPLFSGIFANPSWQIAIRTSVLAAVFPVSMVSERFSRQYGIAFYGFLILLYLAVFLHV